jgi:hypothetical protein
VATTSVQHSLVPLSGRDRKRVEIHLEHLLQSPAFAGSRRCRDFLSYVVNEALSGRGTAIKERNIAVDVFAKGPDFDSQSESIVRVNAAEVRRRLSQEYTLQPDHPVRIDLPVGSYLPVFHLVPASLPPVTAIPEAGSRAWKPILAVPALAFVAWAAFAFHLSPGAPVTDLFWQPFTNSKNPVMISLPAPTVLQLSHQEKWLPLHSGTAVPAEDLRAMDTWYVGTGAAYGAARFAEQLALRHQPFLVKFGRDVAFSDLNNGPALLLGAYSSFWTMELTQPLRFRLENHDGIERIVDQQRPDRVWIRYAAREPAEVPEGYALVTRLLKSESGWPLLIAAGMSARDTQAAVEFLTKPGSLESLAKELPSDWPRRNLQVVLHCFTHGHSPGAPTVLAWHVW